MTTETPQRAIKVGDLVRFFSSPHSEPMKVTATGVGPDKQMIEIDRYSGQFRSTLFKLAET